MSFAQKILAKYGWKEGEGLGKNSDGISEPLRANLKFDNAGLGVDRADEFNNHWWERVFNEASKNVEIQKDGDTIMVNRKNDESVEITTKEYSVRKLKKKSKQVGSYDNFLSSATLTNTGDEVANPFKIEAKDIELAPYKPLTDAELFAACGGRTAHKGARHGLKLSGKLARIEQQEKELLLKMQTNPPEQIPDSWTIVKSKKKKNKSKSEEDPPTLEEEDSKLNSLLFTTEYCIKSKKKRKEQKKTQEELSKSLDSFSLEKENEDETLLALSENSKAIKKLKKEKKSKKKSKPGSNIDSYRDRNDTEAIETEEIAETAIPSAEEIEEPSDVPLKKKHKKCKHGIDKDAKAAHKKAKKMKRNLRNLTEDLEKSFLVEA